MHQIVWLLIKMYCMNIYGTTICVNIIIEDYYRCVMLLGENHSKHLNIVRNSKLCSQDYLKSNIQSIVIRYKFRRNKYLHKIQTYFYFCKDLHPKYKSKQLFFFQKISNKCTSSKT